MCINSRGLFPLGPLDAQANTELTEVDGQADRHCIDSVVKMDDQIY
jgi:hypothetical protein